MDYAFQGRRPPSQLQAMIENSVYDQEWYADSAANAHITHDINNLNIQEPLRNNDAITVGNGSTIDIANSGSTILNTSHNNFILNNVLHCP